MRINIAAAALATVVSAGTAHAGCAGAQAPCEIATGTYHITLPDQGADPEATGTARGAIMFLHGFGGSGRSAIRPQGWAQAALARGYAVIGPDGMPREAGRGNSWSFHPDRPSKRDEIAFIKAVRADAMDRFGLEAMSLGGFSIGGSMTHYFACTAPEVFDAYLPVGGAFWRPHPEGCAGPVRLLHTHGWTDTTVPLEGRVVRGIDARDPQAFVQGDVFHAMQLWRGANGCVQLRADHFTTKGPFMSRGWDRCAEGSALELALFAGGHVVPKAWADMALDWLENL